MEIIDLTHSLAAGIPAFDLACRFELAVGSDYRDYSGTDKFRVQGLALGAGIGTHIDSPAHCIAGGRTVERLKLAELVVDCAVIKIDGAGENYLAGAEVIERFEQAHGRIPAGCLAIFHTGWDRFWGEPVKYRNTLKFPGVSAEAARLLVERGAVGIGIDTLSADAGGEVFPVHRTILGADKYLLENISGAGALPPLGAKIYVLPMKIAGATEAPARVIAVF